MVFIDIPVNDNAETTTLSWDNDANPILNGIPCKPIEDPEDIYDVGQMVKGMLEKYW